jgi:hypothetical protein
MYVLPKEKEAHAMKANYSMTGTEKRDLVHAIERITGEKAEYQFVPTCAYEIGNITVDKEGAVICEDEEKLGRVMVRLGQMGYCPDAEQPADPEPGQETVQEAIEPAQEPEGETTGLTISLPLTAANVGTLTNLISAKESLIKKALGITDTRIRVTEDKIEFPWFDRELTPDETHAYMLFITQLCKLSKELKHASSRPVETDNEKYAFRTWLLRMGFIGPDFKAARKILLKNLSGSSAFRNGAPKKEAVENEEVAE